MEGKVYGADKGRRKPRERATDEGGADQSRDDAPSGWLSVSALSPSATPPVLMRQALPEQHVHDSPARGWHATAWQAPRGERPLRQDAPATAPAEPDRPDRWSLVARLFAAMEARVIPKLVETHAHASKTPFMRPDAADMDRFFDLLLADDVPSLERAVEDLVARGLSAESIVLDLLVASARRMGLRWLDDCSDFVAVTVAVGRLQQLLRQLSPVLCSEAGPRSPGMRVILVQPQDEAHMFGLSVAGEFFRRDGWDVVGGVGSAVTDPAQRVRAEWFDVAGLSVGSETRLPWVRDCVAALKQHSLNPALVVLVGGPVFSAQPERVREIGADLCADAVAAPALAAKMAAERQQHAPGARRPQSRH
jgi:MerR family transcriptional regulator, light-induced transcriptional regulator